MQKNWMFLLVCFTNSMYVFVVYPLPKVVFKPKCAGRNLIFICYYFCHYYDFRCKSNIYWAQIFQKDALISLVHKLTIISPNFKGLIWIFLLISFTTIFIGGDKSNLGQSFQKGKLWSCWITICMYYAVITFDFWQFMQSDY